MPQEIHVVQCYSCRMHQVDIVKKVNKWKCKLCGEKQSLRTVFFQGSGKECRIQVQKLNELMRNAEQKQFSENVSSCVGQSSGVSEDFQAANQTNWLDFNDENSDAINDEDFRELSSVDETCRNQVNKSENHRQFTWINESNDLPSTWSNIQGRSIHEQITNQIEVPVAKVRQIDTNILTKSEWDQFLPDELSD